MNRTLPRVKSKGQKLITTDLEAETGLRLTELGHGGVSRFHREGMKVE